MTNKAIRDIRQTNKKHLGNPNSKNAWEKKPKQTDKNPKHKKVQRLDRIKIKLIATLQI